MGADHDGEVVAIDGGRVHVFECFALVNFLLCSAVPPNDASKKRILRLAGSHGRSSRTMQTNCSRHFRAALEILEPTLIVAQRHGVRSWMARAYGLPTRRPQNGIEQMQIGAATAMLVTFSHPSAHGALNGGLNEQSGENLRARMLPETLARISSLARHVLAVQPLQSSSESSE